MKKAVVVLMVLVFFLSLNAGLFAQETAYDVEGWKKRVASPTYGLAIGMLSVTDDDGNEIDTIPVPGFELRIFNGTNAAKRGGFYVGYEVGTILFVMGNGHTYARDDYGGSIVAVRLEELFVGTLFVMSKYGYRIDLGLEAAGVSLGVEMGMGLQTSLGGVDVVQINNLGVETTNWSQVPYPVSLTLDAAAEAAFRFGQNFRLFARAGVMLIPQIIEVDYEDAPVENFDAEMIPGIPTVRVGFALNY